MQNSQRTWQQQQLLYNREKVSHRIHVCHELQLRWNLVSKSKLRTKTLIGHKNSHSLQIITKLKKKKNKRKKTKEITKEKPRLAYEKCAFRWAFRGINKINCIGSFANDYSLFVIRYSLCCCYWILSTVAGA